MEIKERKKSTGDEVKPVPFDEALRRIVNAPHQVKPKGKKPSKLGKIKKKK